MNSIWNKVQLHFIHFTKYIFSDQSCPLPSPLHEHIRWPGGIQCGASSGIPTGRKRSSQDFLPTFPVTCLCSFLLSSQLNRAKLLNYFWKWWSSPRARSSLVAAVATHGLYSRPHPGILPLDDHALYGRVHARYSEDYNPPWTRIIPCRRQAQNRQRLGPSHARHHHRYG